MSELTISQRYDQFQDEAVAAVAADFTEKPNGRYLLVVPTGGGKTFVAVKAVNSLFAAGTFDPASDRIAWIAHRSELLTIINAMMRTMTAWQPEIMLRRFSAEV